MPNNQLTSVTENQSVTVIKNGTIQLNTYNGTYVSGQMYLNNTNVNSVIENPLLTVSTTNILEDVIATINTTEKVPGRVVYNSDNKNLYYAQANLPISPWTPLNGNPVITPGSAMNSSTTQLSNADTTINSNGKIQYKLAFNTSNKLMYYASGATKLDQWIPFLIGEPNIVPIDGIPPFIVSMTRSGTSTLNISNPFDIITFTLNEPSIGFNIGSVTVVNGSLSEFTTLSTILYSVKYTAPSNLEGSGSITVDGGKFTDIYGNFNLATINPLSIPFDCIAPAQPTIGSVLNGETPVTNGSSSNATILVLSGMAESGSTVKVYNGTIVTPLGTVTATALGSWTFTAGSNLNPLTNGTYGFYVTATDAAGNTSLASSNWNVTIDTVVPGFSISRNPTGILNIANRTTTITFNLNEPASFDNTKITSSSGSFSAFSGSGSVYTALFTAALGIETNGFMGVAAGAFTDLAGNPSAAPAPLPIGAIDTVAPSVTITRSGTGLLTKSNQTAVITFTLSEASTNLDPTKFTSTNGLLTGFAGSGLVYTATFTAALEVQGNGTITVLDAAFRDLAGNPSLGSNTIQIAIDTISQSMAITRSGTGPLTNVNLTDLITFTLSEASTDFADEDVVVTNGTKSGFTGSGTLYSVTFTANSGVQGNGTIDVDTVYSNGTIAGRAAEQLSIPIDTVSPAVNITRTGTGTLTLAVGQSAGIQFTFSEQPTTFDVGNVSVTNGTLSVPAYLSGLVWESTFIPTPGFEGTGTIRIAGGAVPTSNTLPILPSNTLQLLIDTKPPTVAISRSSNGVLNISNPTNTITFTLSEASTILDSARISSTNGTLTGLSGSGSEYTATFTANSGVQGNGTITVDAGAFADAVGNPNAATAQLSFPIDTISPEVNITRSGTGTLTQNNRTDLITFTLSESSTNFNINSVTLVNGSLSTPFGTSDNVIYTSTFTAALEFLGDGAINVALGAFTDAVGNPNVATAELIIPIDTVTP